MPIFTTRNAHGVIFWGKNPFGSNPFKKLIQWEKEAMLLGMRRLCAAGISGAAAKT
jgi:hypothetical protein